MQGQRFPLRAPCLLPAQPLATPQSKRLRQEAAATQTAKDEGASPAPKGDGWGLSSLCISWFAPHPGGLARSAQHGPWLLFRSPPPKPWNWSGTQSARQQSKPHPEQGTSPASLLLVGQVPGSKRIRGREKPGGSRGPGPGPGHPPLSTYLSGESLYQAKGPPEEPGTEKLPEGCRYGWVFSVPLWEEEATRGVSGKLAGLEKEGEPEGWARAQSHAGLLRGH